MRSDELRRALEQIDGYREAEREALPGKAVALAVARFRADQGMTQQELADKVGTTQSVVARIESGRRAPNVKILNQIAAQFGLTWRVSFEPAAMETPAAVAAIPQNLFAPAKLIEHRIEYWVEPKGFQLLISGTGTVGGKFTTSAIVTSADPHEEPDFDVIQQRDGRLVPFSRRTKPTNDPLPHLRLVSAGR